MSTTEPEPNPEPGDVPARPETAPEAVDVPGAFGMAFTVHPDDPSTLIARPSRTGATRSRHRPAVTGEVDGSPAGV